MIHQIHQEEQATTLFLRLFQLLKISQLLHQCGIRKTKGIAVKNVFTELLMLVFQGKNLYRHLLSQQGQPLPGKDTFYRFLNNSHYSWRRLLLKLSEKVICKFIPLTSQQRINVLILDDSVVTRSRSKNVELMAKIYDHSRKRYVRGYTMLTLGWSDGYSFLPVDFAMMSSANETNRINESFPVDKRTNGYKRRCEAIQKKPKVAAELVRNALNQGIAADYVLMDSWYTTEPLIASLLNQSIDVIGMVKDLKQRYQLNGKSYTIKELRGLLKNNRQNIIGSLVVTTKTGIKVKIVFTQSRENRRRWLAVLSTDTSLDDEKIIQIYGRRWKIEEFFKATKSLLKLGTEFQGRSYDMIISHTTIVYVRYIFLEWERRQNQDLRTHGDLFFLITDEVHDIDLKVSLKMLFAFLCESIKYLPDKAKVLLRQVSDWVQQQPRHIKMLLGDLCCES